MELSRRDLFKLTIITPIARSISLTENKTKFNFHPKQKEFMMKNDLSLYGIPYHESNSSVGTWLGLNREGY